MDHISKHLVQNQELPTVRTEQPRPSEEEKFLVAIQSKKIKELPEIHVRNALKYAMLKVGLRGNNFPTGVTKAMLLDHIFNNYGSHTPDEIRLAFNMAVAGQLSLDDVNCYENFSCLYFSKIMNAYRIWAQQVFEQNKKPVLQIENKPDPEQIEKEYQEFLQTDLGKQLKPNQGGNDERSVATEDK